jgi:nucleotide-binding universal stress UspA family protein
LAAVGDAQTGSWWFAMTGQPTMYHKVVVPLDGSELAEGVEPHVAAVIRDRGSQVYLLSVAPLTKGTAPGVVDLPPSSVGAQDEESRIERQLVQYLRTAAQRLEPIAADVHVQVRFGRPADEILAFVGEVEADLIAMSTHGRSGVSRWVFGSVAERVLRGAACPVLLVRAGFGQPRTAYGRVLVPLDGSELAEQVLPHVKALIRPNHTRVFLVSVLTTGLGDRTVALLTSYPPGLRLATTALHHAEVQWQRYLRSVAAVLREHGAVVHLAVRQGSPADEILAHAAEVEADLISMTTHGLSGMSRWVYGNVAGKVLQGAHSPVLLVRPTS